LSDNLQPTVDDFIKNFPFPTLRESQTSVLNKIATAFASGYKHIVLEAPTGFGKSPVAIAVALTLGTSYICTSTKDLQTQYARDFPFVKVAKGMNNFPCLIKDDFIRNGTYSCGSCTNGCDHKTVEHGPCMSYKSFESSGCYYRTIPVDYKIENKGTREEKVYIDDNNASYYRQRYSQSLYLEHLKEKREWRPCGYFNQLNIALTSSHSIFNYSNFLAFLPSDKILPSRKLLILDEAPLLETEIVTFRGISISKRRWKRYIRNLEMIDYGYNIEKWINFLIDLEKKMVNLTGVSENLAVEAIRDTEKLKQAIGNILENPKNWMVNEIQKENNEVTRVEFKPLNVSPYCE
jgi:ATP-dependent DNA helicase DinG